MVGAEKETMEKRKASGKKWKETKEIETAWSNEVDKKKKMGCELQ